MNYRFPNPFRSPRSSTSAFTLIELLTVTAIIAVLSAAIFPGVRASMRNAQMNAAMQNARQIANGLLNYANDYEGLFPGSFDPETDEEYSTSNEAFRLLIPEYIDTERVFAVAGSAWGPLADGRIEEESERLEPGENHWAYIAGLTNTSRSDWPLIVDGTDGNGTYARLQTEKGGLWEGNKSIVVRVGGSAETVRLRGDEEARYLPRYGYPEENALEIEAYMGDGPKLLDPAD
ncbi:MAG: type II secretion system protein [Verrucomicrobiae bacterium]|nr:type II secretion system protein [Verrucomicrobiae bacterium]